MIFNIGARKKTLPDQERIGLPLRGTGCLRIASWRAHYIKKERATALSGEKLGASAKSPSEPDGHFRQKAYI